MYFAKHPSFPSLSRALSVVAIFSMGQLAHADVNPATTLVVSATPQTSWFQLEANIEAINESTLSAQTSGRIKSIHFDVNDYVEQGALLIQLRDTQQQAGLKQAKAQLAQATALQVDSQAKLIRGEPLYKQGALSKGEFDTISAQAISAKAAVKASQAMVDQAQEQLSYTQIRAPYSGIVKNRLVQVGESVNPGTPLMTGLSLAHLRATAEIPQRFAPKLNNLKDAKVDHQGVLIDAKKVTVFPYADPASHSFKVRVDIDSEGQNLFPGMWVKLNIPMAEKTAIRIPKAAVLQNGELNGVYVMDGSQAKLRQVRLGNLQDGQYEVLAGLTVGDVIAQDAYLQLQEAN